jgi:hypothetical protein
VAAIEESAPRAALELPGRLMSGPTAWIFPMIGAAGVLLMGACKPSIPLPSQRVSLLLCQVVAFASFLGAQSGEAGFNHCLPLGAKGLGALW